MRFAVLKCGAIRTWRHLLAGETAEPVRMDVPVPFFVIGHQDKLILFDCGQKKPEKAATENADYMALVSDDDRVSTQLNLHGFDPEKVTHIIISHAHGDHCGCLDEFEKAECFIQSREVSTAAGAELLKRFPAMKWHVCDGREDITGDGRVVAVPTYGHTPGHQSLLVTLDDGSQVCLAGDALYLECALDDDAEVRFSSAEAVAFLRQMRDDGVTIISGHDPESFEYHQKNYNRI